MLEIQEGVVCSLTAEVWVKLVNGNYLEAGWLNLLYGPKNAISKKNE